MGYSVLLVVNFIAEYPNEVSSYLTLEIIMEIQGTEEQSKDESDCQGWCGALNIALGFAGKVSPYLKSNMLHSQQVDSILRLDRPGCASNKPCDLEQMNI